MAFTRYSALCLLALCPGLACSGGSPGAPPSRPSQARLEVEVDARGLSSYAWNDGPRVPFTGGAESAGLIHGEAGVTDDTRLYLPFNEGTGPETRDGSPQSLDVDLHNTAWTDGRFGAALEFPSGNSSVRVRSRNPQLFHDHWTFELWVRPADGRGGQIARAPGLFTLAVDGDLRVRVEVQTEPPVSLRTQEPLRRGEWNHVALALDGPEIPTVRLVVNAAPSMVQFEGRPAAGAADITVGGDPQGGITGAIDDLRVRAHAVASAELAARSLGEVEVGMHRLELGLDEGALELEVWAHPWTEPVIDDDAGWSQGDLEHAWPAEGKLRWVPGHWEQIRSDSPPLARTTHPTVYVGDNRVFMWGGETRDTHLNPMFNTDDTWFFRTDTLEWERVFTESAPPPSCHQPAAWSPDHRFLLYAGGWRNDHLGTFEYNQTWAFFPDERRWEKLEPEGQPFPTTSNCGLVYFPPGKRFLMFRAGPGRVMGFDPARNRWNLRPQPRYLGLDGEPHDYRPGGSFMLGYDPEAENLVLFAGGLGLGEQSYHNETVIYDARENTFTVLEPDTAPAPRVRSGFAYDSKRKHFVLFGGVLGQFSERMDDLWVYDPAERQWTEHLASNTPSRRGGFYGMAYDPDADHFFLLCGRHAPERFLDEAWSLHFDAATGGRAAYVFDRQGFAEADRWFAQWSQPGASQVHFRFRASTDAAHWGEWNDEPDAVITGDARFVQVEIELTPDEAGLYPELSAMGFGSAEEPGPTPAEGYERMENAVEPLR